MTPPPLVVVTGNKKKAEEIAAITGYQVEMVELDLPEIQHLDVSEVARMKARDAFQRMKRPLIVDDTGMSIEVLNGLPGALVTWFLERLGPEGILRLVGPAENRRASVSTCIAYADETGIYPFMGTIQGMITTKIRGVEGFGYDPIFIPQGETKTYAEMTPDEKNHQSMRRRALEQLKTFLETRR